MNNKQKTPLSILADREVFDYLKEKVGERKTRTEAYCDLLDKALSGFVSPFLRKQDYELQPHQCHVTVSDLASDWHWHRATVRSFLDTIEAFGLLERIRLAKSVVITMAVQSGQPAAPHDVQERPDFAGQLREALSDWVVGRTTESEVGTRCGQLVSQAMSETADRAAGYCPDSRFDTAAGHTSYREAHVRETALGCIAHAALQKNLRKSRFADTSPLVEFFRRELGGEWTDFIEVAKDLARLVLDTGATEAADDTDEPGERLKSLRNPFLSLAARAQDMAD